MTEQASNIATHDSTLADLDWPVRTKRLSIRPAHASDADASWRYYQVGSVREWMSVDSASVDEYRALFMKPDRLARTLVVELDCTVIGDLKVDITSPWAQQEMLDQARNTEAELGWCFSPDHSGYGYASEAVSEVMRICFEKLGLRRVTALCFADNAPSWRLMERVGMRREMYTVRDSLHRSGEWLDGMAYALLADEWRARR